MMLRIGLMILMPAFTLAAPLPKELRVNCDMDGRWNLDYQVIGLGSPFDNVQMHWNINGENLVVSTIPGDKFRFVRQQDGGTGAYDYTDNHGNTRTCRVERTKDRLKVAMPIDVRGARPEQANPGSNILYFEFELVKE